MTIESGSKLGPYEIIEPIGAGGMGEVFKARDTRLDRDVAIKVLPDTFAADEQFLQRFEREAKTISSLNHPNICVLHDIGEQDGHRYLVMEYIDGESLAERLAKGPLPIDQVIRYGGQVAEALDKAHRQGIVHRDLKPGNVMITKTGAKLLDFGLAKTSDAVLFGSRRSSGETAGGTTHDQPTQQRPLTQEGTILGTFLYMAPEQLEGIEADTRTDIFALGAVLYEMATGQKPFSGKSKASLIASILDHQPPTISSVQPMTPPAFDHVVRRCMEKDPEDRWQSAHDVASSLRWIGEAGSQAGVAAPVTIRRKTRERLAWGIAMLCAIISLAAVWAALGFRDDANMRPVLRSAIEPPEKVLFDFRNVGGPPELAPNGHAIVFSGENEDGSTQLYLRRLDSLEIQAISGTEGASYPFWSPDSAYLAFFQAGKLRKVPSAGGAIGTICDAPDGRGGTWSESGTIVIGTRDGGLRKVSASGGTLEELTKVPGGDDDHRWPWMLPGSDRFLYAAREFDNPSEVEIRVGSIDGSVDKKLTRASSNPAFTDGYLLFASAGTLVAQKFDPGSLELGPETIPIAENVTESSNFSRSMFTVSSTGLLAYYTGKSNARTILTWYGRDGSQLGTLGDEAIHSTLLFSPDGKYAGVSIEDETIGTGDIWIYETQRGVKTRFTFDAMEELGPVWSPDGEMVYFSKLGVGGCRRPSSGSGDFECPKEWSDLVPMAFTPDGEKMLMNSWGGQEWDVVSLSMDTNEPEAVVQSSFREFGQSLSPDGKYVIYTSNESAQTEVYATTFPKASGKWQISVGGGGSARWSPDGREIFYVTPDHSQLMSVALIKGDLSEVDAPRLLFSIPNAPRDNFSWAITPDGKRFLVTVGTEAAREEPPMTLVTNWTRVIANR